MTDTREVHDFIVKFKQKYPALEKYFTPRLLELLYSSDLPLAQKIGREVQHLNMEGTIEKPSK
jgi:hypothetical protein